MIWAFVTVAGVLAMTDLFPDLMNQRKFSWMSLGVFALVAAPLCLGYLRSNAAKLTPIIVLFETAILVIGSGAVLIVLRHMFAQTDNIEYLELGFYATLALVMAGVQLRRAKFAESLQFARTILARIYMGGAGLAYLLALILTPLGFAGMRAYGIPPFSTVFLAYLSAPALLAFGFWKSGLITLPDRFRRPIYAAFTAISVFVLIQEVRHLWHGSTISFNKGVVTGELYSYTVLLLLLTIGFVFLALKRQDQNLRRYALIAAALTAAKVFTFDMGGMSGLPRATAFILLGLSLAGIGWLLQGVQKPDEPETDADDET